jgi:hypothetical protein
LAIFRLHEASKTMSGKTPFDPDDVKLRGEYMPYLSFFDRRLVRSSLRRQRARMNRKEGWAALKRRDLTEARRRAWATVSNAFTSIESWRLMYCALRGH